jgi:hypothetical protein
MRQYLEYDPIAGWRFIPNIRARIPHEGGGYLVRANELGFRSDVSFVTKRQLGKKRALLFGDSFTAGDGVSNGQRFSEVLENLEIFNFGLPATSPDQQFLLFKRYAAAIEHDFVIIAVCVENIRRVLSRYRPFADDNGLYFLYEKPFFELEGGERLRLNGTPPSPRPVDATTLDVQQRRQIYKIGRYPLLRKIYTSLKPVHEGRSPVLNEKIKERLQRIFSYQPLPEYNSPSNLAWRTMRAILLDWVTNQQRPVIIVPLPLVHYVLGISNPRPYLQRYAEVAQISGAVLVNMLPALFDYSEEARRSFFFGNDCHPTKRGHDVFASAMAPAITEVLDGLAA